MADKEPIGYKTPSQQLEQLLNQKRESINEKKADWDKELKDAIRLEASAEKLVSKLMAEPHHAPIGLDLYNNLVLRYMTGLIAKLGLDLATLSEELAEIRKVTEEIKSTK